MGAVYNEGSRTLPVAGAADIGAYLLVDFASDGTIKPYVEDSGAILWGSTDSTSESGYVSARPCNVSGTRYLKLDAGETIAIGGWFTFGTTAGTIKPVGSGDPILGYSLDAATSGATTYAVVECILLPGLADCAGAVVNGDLPNFPVGPVVPLT